VNPLPYNCSTDVYDICHADRPQPRITHPSLSKGVDLGVVEDIPPIEGLSSLKNCNLSQMSLIAILIQVYQTIK